MNNIKDDTTMELQYIFDYAIRDKEGKPYGEGYTIAKSESVYDRYMSNDGWNRYLTEMSEEHRKQYDEVGQGGELKEGRYPPKMACYGSSSRIIYTILQDIDGIKFECPLLTKVGSRPANLDAYRRANNTEIFVEAKCREIYVQHKMVKASRTYCKVYEYIRDKYIGFSFYTEEITDKEGNVNESDYNYSFFHSNKPIIRFDIKQLISHFLGIVAGVLNGRVKNEIRFVYFIYNPTELNNKKLSDIYSKTIEEVNIINISELFKAVFEYQKKNLKVEKDLPKFEFVLADQNNIKSKL